MSTTSIIKNVLTEKAIYIAIGVLGCISSVITVLSIHETMVPIFWLYFIIFIMLTIVIVLVRIIVELMILKEPNESIKVIRYNKEESIFILKSSIPIAIQSLVSVYWDDDGFERLHSIALVQNVQKNKLVQIQIIKVINEKSHIDVDNAIIKLTIPYETWSR